MWLPSSLPSAQTGMNQPSMLPACAPRRYTRKGGDFPATPSFISQALLYLLKTSPMCSLPKKKTHSPQTSSAYRGRKTRRSKMVIVPPSPPRPPVNCLRPACWWGGDGQALLPCLHSLINVRDQMSLGKVFAFWGSWAEHPTSCN